MKPITLALLAAAAFAGQISASAAQTSSAPAQDPQQRARDLVLSAPRTAERSSAVPRGYAIVIGVGDYERLDPSKRLRYSESDADAIYRVLISQEGGAFPAENVKFLRGKDATLENMRQAIDVWLPSVAQPNDRVFVYFAGHGFVQGGRGYLAPWDVDPARLDKTAYPMASLGEGLANKVKANWKVLLTDACHSDKMNIETTDEGLEQQINALPHSFMTLSATTQREQSFEDPNLATGFGLFTYFVVQAFRGYADNNPCDGRITADELIEYVRSNVRGYARARSLLQTPTARGDYEPEMLLGVATGCLGGTDGNGDKAASMLGTAVIETNLDEVDVYIDGRLTGRMSRAKPLVVPSLSSGMHEFRGVAAGYEPDRKEVMIAPGQEVAVTLRIRYPRQIRKEALDLNEQGERLLFTRRSSLSLLNLVPVERRQSEADLRRAAELFERALALEPTYAVAAYHLGQVFQLLLDFDTSVKYFRQAVAIDPTHVDARIECAAVLIEHGDPDEAIRGLVEVTRLESSNAQAYSMLSRAYWDKQAWSESIRHADQALTLDPSDAQAHLWRADARRQLAAIEAARKSAAAGDMYQAARDDYREFLDLTNFSNSLGSKLAFYFIGFGAGARVHADRQAAYDSLRSSGFLGLCLCEQKVGNPLRAREYCARALKYAPNDPIAYFLLGNVNRDLFNVRQSCGDLQAARQNYAKMLELNSDIDEARNARGYLEQITVFAAKLRCGR